MNTRDAAPEVPPRPFPDSLCHACSAPPRYITSDRGAVFIHCPRLSSYPPQPVRVCDHYTPTPTDD